MKKTFIIYIVCTLIAVAGLAAYYLATKQHSQAAIDRLGNTDIGVSTVSDGL